MFVGRSSRTSLSHKQYHRPPLQRYERTTSASSNRAYARDDSAIQVENLSMIWHQTNQSFLVSDDDQDSDFYKYNYSGFFDGEEEHEAKPIFTRGKGSSTRGGIYRSTEQLDRMDSMDSATFAFRGANHWANRNLGHYHYENENNSLSSPRGDLQSQQEEDNNDEESHRVSTFMKMNRQDMLESIREQVDTHKRLLDMDKGNRTKVEQKRHNRLLLGYDSEDDDSYDDDDDDDDGNTRVVANTIVIQNNDHMTKQKNKKQKFGKVAGWWKQHFGDKADPAVKAVAISASMDSTDHTSSSSGNPADHEYVMCSRPRLQKTVSEMRRGSF